MVFSCTVVNFDSSEISFFVLPERSCFIGKQNPKVFRFFNPLCIGSPSAEGRSSSRQAGKYKLNLYWKSSEKAPFII